MELCTACLPSVSRGASPVPRPSRAPYLAPGIDLAHNLTIRTRLSCAHWVPASSCKARCDSGVGLTLERTMQRWEQGREAVCCQGEQRHCPEAGQPRRLSPGTGAPPLAVPGTCAHWPALRSSTGVVSVKAGPPSKARGRGSGLREKARGPTHGSPPCGGQRAPKPFLIWGP